MVGPTTLATQPVASVGMNSRMNNNNNYFQLCILIYNVKGDMQGIPLKKSGLKIWFEADD